MVDTYSLKIGGLRINELFEESLDSPKDYVQVIREYLTPFFETLSDAIPEKLSQFIVSGNEIQTIASMCNATNSLDFSIMERTAFTKMYKKSKGKRYRGYIYGIRYSSRGSRSSSSITYCT